MLGFGVLGFGLLVGHHLWHATAGGGLHLDVGLFDPVQLQGRRILDAHLGFLQSQAELTFDRSLFGSGFWAGRVVLFGNGAYQKVYKDFVLRADSRSLSDDEEHPV